MGWIRQRATIWVLRRALEKNAPTLIPTSGEKAEKNDVYAVYLLDQEGVARLVANDITDHELIGKWSLNGKEFTEERSVPLSELPQYRLWIQHYYRGWTFHSVGVWRFILNRLTRFPFFRVKVDNWLQSRFNRKELTRRDRMKVLEHIMQETIKNRDFEVGNTGLLTHFYTVRWVYRPEKAELQTYYDLLLDSLKESGDLVKGQYGFKLHPKALNTIADFELEDRRHRDNYLTQRGLLGLTRVLIAVGVIQAAAAAYEAFWEPETVAVAPALPAPATVD